MISTYVHQCPQSVSSAVMQLLDEWQRGEVSADEYNRRFAELQAEAQRAKMESARAEIEN